MNVFIIINFSQILFLYISILLYGKEYEIDILSSST